MLTIYPENTRAITSSTNPLKQQLNNEEDIPANFCKSVLLLLILEREGERERRNR